MLSAKQALAELESIGDNRLAVANQEEVLLRQRGWEHTCDNPMSCWMWRKRIVNATGSAEYVVNRETALELEQRICEREAA